MQRLIIAILLSIFTLSAAAVDIRSACQERDEQKKALMSKISTSISEALLAGQCTGYEQTSYTYSNRYSFAKLPQACSEFVEQKKAILPFNMSTSLLEAKRAGMCMGAIYKIAKDCQHEHYRIDYDYIADYVRHLNRRQALDSIAEYVGCR
jgi:hypothetical protein